jgi:hypothetical protein
MHLSTYAGKSNEPRRGADLASGCRVTHDGSV